VALEYGERNLKREDRYDLEDELDSAEVWFDLVAHSQRIAQQDARPGSGNGAGPQESLPDPSMVIRFAEAARDRTTESASVGGTAAAPIKPAEPNGSGPLVLVVEDNPVNSFLVNALLMQEGFEVLLASDALSALGLLGYHRPGLIVMDLGLPDMDGLELARRIKSESATSEIPIVALTAYRADIFGGSARDAGFVGYVEKPLKPADFLGAVRRYVAA